MLFYEAAHSRKPIRVVYAFVWECGTTGTFHKAATLKLEQTKGGKRNS